MKEKLTEIKKKIKDRTPVIITSASTVVAISAVAIALHYRNRLVDLESDERKWMEVTPNMERAMRTEGGLTIRQTGGKIPKRKYEPNEE